MGGGNDGTSSCSTKLAAVIVPEIIIVPFVEVLVEYMIRLLERGGGTVARHIED